MGWDLVLVETVGVGQDEVEVQRLAHTTVVVMAPGMGDEIQAIKAGILEIADIFAVNKSDREGADRTVRELRLMLDMGKESIAKQDRVCPKGWMPQVIKTVSTTGEGVDELMTALSEHRQAYEDACKDPAFVTARLRREFLDVFRRTLFARGWSYLMHEDHLKEIVGKLQDGSSNPYTLAEQAVNALGRF
jgi:LAO/AO transport system kinase